ncbi:MAG: hypothetical protein ABIT83_01575, partial [Massilia sp.]
VHQGGGSAADAALEAPENEASYPEPSMFGVTPCHGLFVRHVNNLEIHHVTIRGVKPDFRPALALQNVNGVSIERASFVRGQGAPLLVLRQVSDFTLKNSPGLADTRFETATQNSL